MLIPGKPFFFLFVRIQSSPCLASPYCRGMIRRVISQSGTGLAPWSINRQPMKLLERFSQDFNCNRSNETEMLECINKLLQESNGDIYRLHLSLNIGKIIHLRCPTDLRLRFSSLQRMIIHIL